MREFAIPGRRCSFPLEALIKAPSPSLDRLARIVDDALVEGTHRDPQNELVHECRSQQRKADRVLMTRDAGAGHRATKKGHLLVCETSALAIRSQVRC